MTMRLAFVVLGLLLLVSPSNAATAEGIAGFEGDRFDQGYGFVSLGTLSDENQHYTFPARVSASYLYYNYLSGGNEIDVDAPGISGMVGVRSIAKPSTFTALVGAELRWERRQPAVSTDSAGRVARGGIVLQAESDIALSKRVDVPLIFNYAGASQYLWGRAAVRYQVSNLDWRGPSTWFVGVDGVGQGNPDTNAIQGGASVECTLVNLHLSVGLHAGYKSTAAGSDRRESGYLGLGLYHRF
jgi:hypothetical protein